MFYVKGNPQLNKESFTFSENGEYPYFTRTVFNNGIYDYANYLDQEHLIKGNSLAVGMMACKFFYMEHDFYAGQFTKTCYPRFQKFNEKIATYFISLLNCYSDKLKGVLVRDFESTFYSIVIDLPTYHDEIAFDYMESYIRELEQERIRELDAYLKATGLNDYELTLDEKKLEENFFKSGGRFKKFKIGELFDIHPTKSYGYTNTKLFDSIGNTPVVVNSSKNNGIGGRVNLAPTEKANTITFSDTTTAESIFVQDEMFIGYSHVQGLYPYKDEWSKRSLMYFATLFRKNAIQMKFDYANKFNRSKASDMFVLLPVNNLDQVAFDFMEHYIKAVEKICIRSIVVWKDKIIETTKTMVNQIP